MTGAGLKPVVPVSTPIDFQQQLTDWQSKASEGYKLLADTQAKINSKTQAIMDKQKFLSTPRGFRVPFGINLNNVLPKSLTLPSSFESKYVKEEMVKLRNEVSALTVESIKQELYSSIYSILPYAIMSGQAGSVDDAMALIPTKFTENLTTDEVANYRKIVGDMLSSVRGARPAETVQETEFPELEAPSTAAQGRIGMASLQSLTTQEILKSLTVPKIPPSVLTKEEWQSFIDEAGLPVDPSQEVKDLVADWQERANQIAAFQEGIGEIPDYKFGDMLKDYFATPGLALADAFGVYYNKVGAPLAGMFTTDTGLVKTAVPVAAGGIAGGIAGTFLAPGVGTIMGFLIGTGAGVMTSQGLKAVSQNIWKFPDIAMMNIPDLDKAFEEFDKTESKWVAAGLAWENYDTNWALKMAVETIVDPLTYVGWSSITRLTKPIPYVGRLAGASEAFLNAVVEVPFDALRAGWSIIPKTVTQRALLVQHSTAQVTKKFLESAFKKPFTRITSEEFTAKIGGLVEKSIKYAQEHVWSEAPVAQFGRELLSHTAIDDTITKQLAARVGVTLTDEQITKHMVANINDIFEDMFTTREFDVAEAARLMQSDVFKNTITEETTKKLATALEARSESIVNKAMSLTQSKNFAEFGKTLAKRNSQIYMTTADATAALSRKQYGAFQKFLFDKSEPLVSVWRNQIDRLVIRPFAEAYLTFGMYGPMNVVEDYMRSALGGVTPGSMDLDSAAFLWKDLNVDPILLEPGTAASDMIGYLRTGTPDEWNNWVLQVATLGQKQWADKLYTGLVRLPGAYSMSVRRNFIAGKYLQLLNDAGNETFWNLMKSGPGGLPAISDAKLANRIANTVHYLKTTADAKTIRQALDMFTKKRVVRGEVNNILMKHPEIANSGRETILRAYDDGSLMRSLESINAKIQEVDDIILSDFIRSPERAIPEMKTLADHLVAMDVTDPEALATLMVNLRVMSNTYGMLPEQIMAQSSLRSRGMKFTSRNDVINADMDRVLEFIDKAGVDVDRVITKIQASLKSAGMDGQFSANAQQLFNTMTARRLRMDRFRTENIEFRKQYFKSSNAAQRKSSGFWDNFYNQDDLMRQELSLDIAKTDGMLTRQLKAMDQMRGNGLPARPAVIVEGRAMSPADISAVLQTRNDDITKSLLDVMTVQSNRDQFIEFVKAYADNPGDVGFTDDAIGKVYDQLVADITQGSGKPVNWLTQQKMSLEGMRQDFHNLYNSKLLPDSEIQTIRKYIFDHAQAVDDVTHTTVGGRSAVVQKWLDTPNDMIVQPPAEVYDILKRQGFSDDYIRGSGAAPTTATFTTSQGSTYNVTPGGRTVRNKAKRAGDAQSGLQPESARTYYVTEDQMNKLSEVTTSGASKRIAETSDGKIGVQYQSGKDTGKFEGRTVTEFADSPSVGLHPVEIWDDGSYHFGNKITSVKEATTSTYTLPMTVDEMKRVVNEVPEKGKRALRPEYGASYNDFRQKAVDEAHKWYYREYVDYTHANAFDSLMKNIYPYWTYESQRLTWIPRTFLKHPGTFTTFERYQSNTDGGRIHIPGSSLDINPLRGTIFGAAMFRNQRRDYSSYYDQLGAVGAPLKAMDIMSRYGFYPNALISGFSAAFGGVDPQMGETLPSIWKSPLDLAIAAFPDNEFVKTISDKIFHDRFRDYMTVLEVTAQGGDGLNIWSKMKSGEKLTDEEAATWTRGRQSAALYGALFEQTGLFNLNPQERVDVQQAASKFIEERTGITEDQQKQLEERGIRVWDLVGGMSPSDQQILKEMNFYRWTGLSRPLLPGPQQQVLNQIDKAWSDITTYTEGQKSTKLELERQFLNGEVGPADYSAGLSEIYQSQRTYIDSKEKENPLITLEGRKKYFQEQGVAAPVLNPMKELLNLYFSIKLNKIKDPVTGEVVDDWDSFWNQRLALESSIPPEYQKEWDDYLSRNSTPMEKLRRSSQDYFKKYNQVYEAITLRFSPPEQDMLKEYDYLAKTGMDLMRQQEIEGLLTADGRQLVSAFRTDVSNAREALRRANPSLDAWLNYWGRVTSFKTPQARDIYLRLMSSTGRRYQP